MYHMKDRWGNTVHWLQPEKTFENYYDLPVVIQKKPVNKFYFIEYVKIKSDGTYERIKDAQKIDLIMANNVMVTSGIATQLSEEPREIEGLELTRTTVIQVDEPKKKLDESVYGDDRYIIYDSSNVRPGDKVTGLFKAIEDIREWKDPHLVLYYKEKGDINANIKTDKNRYNIKVGETARIKISTSAELEDVKEPSRVGELWSSLESVICEGVEYENGGKETKVEKRITVDNPSSDMYKYEISGLSKGIHKVKIRSNAWWIDENGVKSELKSPVEKVVTIVVQSEEGGIVFDPKETSWTNEGRESQGKGRYKVNVSYRGDNPFLEAGEIVINKHEDIANPPIVTTNPDGLKTSTPQPSTITDEERTETFEVTFELESISVSGDAQGEFGPDGGDLFIEKVGADLKLNGEGKWGEPQFQLPPLGDGESFVGEPTLPDTPKVPTGEGGVYMLDWTRDRAGNVTTRVFRNYDDPIKLKGLKVIDIKDYAWTPQFWNTKVEPKKLKGKKFGPDEMPIDERTNGGIPGINISKGYAVVFEIKSEYLDFREDTIVIKPTFFYLKDGKRIPCDLYYQLESNPFIKYGSKDDKFNVYYTDALKDNVTGTFTRLELEKNERQVRSEEENVWRFKYYIHYNTYAVEKGKKVYAYPTSALKGGKFLIQFDVKAYRNNEVKPHDFWMRYDYIEKNWKLEGGNKKAEEPGDVLIFDEHSIIDDYDAGGVH